MTFNESWKVNKNHCKSMRVDETSWKRNKYHYSIASSLNFLALSDLDPPPLGVANKWSKTIAHGSFLAAEIFQPEAQNMQTSDWDAKPFQFHRDHLVSKMWIAAFSLEQPKSNTWIVSGVRKSPTRKFKPRTIWRGIHGWVGCPLLVWNAWTQKT